MFTRYFLGRGYRLADVSNVVVSLPAPEPDGLTDAAADTVVVTTYTLGTLREQVARRLNDPDWRVWTAAELDAYLEQGYQELAHSGRVFWDQVYAENAPRAFSVTTTWEDAAASFRYGVANYTLDDERRLMDEANRIGHAVHTCPDEASDGWVDSCGADTSIPATVDLEATVAEVERATYDTAGIDALTPKDLAALDSRYQVTSGPVYGYTWRMDGVRAFRKVRVPAASGDVHTISGQFGAMRDPSDVTGETVTGTWGVARRLPGEHPIGTTQWGLPRRPYRDGTQVKIEHWRTGRALADTEGCELPAPYARYLRDYAAAQALSRNGPGHDPKLAAHFAERWSRGLSRIARRRRLADSARVGTFQPASVLGGERPPRPKLPWNYGQRVRT